MLNPADADLQLKVWKELAVSKQVLMLTAAKALNLDPDCTEDELRHALDGALRKVAEAESSVVQAREQARQSIAEMERKLAAGLKAQSVAEATAAEIIAKQARVAPQMAAERATVAAEIGQLKAQVLEKDKAIKAINTALADTPDNVVRKMKTLKREKQDEADARRELEASFNKLRKEKQDQDKQLGELRDNTTKLITQYRDLHAVTTTLHEQLKPLLKDASQLAALPELDSKLLESIEQPEGGDKNDKSKGDKAKGDKKK